MIVPDTEAILRNPDIIKNPVLIKPTYKPGIKSSEFWLSALTMLISGYASMKANNPYVQIGAQIVTSIIGGSYAVSRGIAKS